MPRQGEEPQDDARDPGEDLQDRLDDASASWASRIPTGRSRWPARSARRGASPSPSRSACRPAPSAGRTARAAGTSPPSRAATARSTRRRKIASKNSDRTMPTLIAIERTRREREQRADERARCVVEWRCRRAGVRWRRAVIAVISARRVIGRMRSSLRWTSCEWRGGPAGLPSSPAGSWRRVAYCAASQAARRCAASLSAGRFTYGTVSRTFEIVPSAR